MTDDTRQTRLTDNAQDSTDRSHDNSEDTAFDDGRDVVNGTAVEEHELHLGSGGLWIPHELREFTGQVVFRTPRATVQHFGSDDLEPYYGMIDESHFGSRDSFTEPQNPGLAPNYVSIKRQGREARIFRVNTDPDVRL